MTAQIEFEHRIDYRQRGISLVALRIQIQKIDVRQVLVLVAFPRENLVVMHIQREGTMSVGRSPIT